MSYLLLLLYSQVRYLWLWRSLFQLFRQISLLPMADAFDRIPPRVAAKFGRFLRTSLQDDIDLEIPLQQCRLVLGWAATSAETQLPIQETLRATVAAHGSGVGAGAVRDRLGACVARSSSWHGPGGRWSRLTAARLPATGSRSLNHRQATTGELDPATSQWLAMAEDLLALRIVYLVSQFAAASPQHVGPAHLRADPPAPGGGLVSLSPPAADVDRDLGVHPGRGPGDPDGPGPDRAERLRQPGGPHRPQRVQARSDLISNLLPYAVPVVGFVLTAFPSLGYWLGSLLEPIGRAVK